MAYQHTQKGTVMIVAMALAIVILVFVASVYREIAYVASILLIVAFLFGSLNVSIDKEFLRISFGIGVIRKKFLLKEIKSCKKVRNSWWYGYGIRYYWKGWLFNVSGLDAVEIEMKDGKLYRIGTDEPDILERELKKVIKK